MKKEIKISNKKRENLAFFYILNNFDFKSSLIKIR